MTEAVYTRNTHMGLRYFSQQVETDGSAAGYVPASISWVDSFTGTRLPNWRAAIRAHRNATTTCSYNKYEATFVPALVSMEGKTLSGQQRYWNAKGATCGTVPYFTTGVVNQGAADNDAAGAFYADARNAMSTFKGSVFAAESRQARRMMFDRASKMLSKIPPFQKRLSRGWVRSKTKRGKLKTLSDNYLELQFGWAPLISDIEDANKALNNPTPQYKRVFGKGVCTETDRVDSSSAIIGMGVIEREYVETAEYQVRYYGEVRARESPTGSVLGDFGLTLREFLPTAWEVIPWSFAVDYFTNVSEIVNAVAYCNADFSWLAKSRRTVRVRTRSANHAPYKFLLSSSQVHYNVSSLFTGKATSFVREPIESVPVPSLSWEIPSLKQALNLTALAISRRLRLAY